MKYEVGKERWYNKSFPGRDDVVLFDVVEIEREQFIKMMIPEPPAAFISDRVKKNIDFARFDLANIFDSATIPEAHKNTGYGMLSAGVEYLDHVRSFQSMDNYIGRTLLKVEPLKKRLVPIIRELAR